MIAIPVILHMMLKAKPKKIIFPALRLIRDRQQPHSQRMRIRHLWLLIMRMLVIGLLVLAVARPTLPAANYWLNRWELMILAGVIVFAVGLYYWMKRGYESANLPPYAVTAKRDWLRTWVIAGTFLAIILGVGLPYQYRVRGEIFTPGKQSLDLPIAAVLLFDSSLSMSYKFEGQTRLEKARQLAAKHLNNLPNDSKIALTDNSTQGEILFQTDLASARSKLEQVDSLTTKALSYPLNQRLLQAITLQQQHREEIAPKVSGTQELELPDRFVREVYLFTDLAQTAWNKESAERLQAELKDIPWLNVYVIDVGQESATNAGILECRLTSEVATAGVPLALDVVLEGSHPTTPQVKVELLMGDMPGPMIKVGEQQVDLKHNQPTTVSFPIKSNAKHWTQGIVQIAASDPLDFDNQRSFTLAVLPPPKILVVSEQPRDGLEWSEALAPDELVKQQRASYQIERATPLQLDQLTLSNYEAVSLINVTQLAPPVIEKMGNYIQWGGVVFVALGSTQVNALNYQTMEWLPSAPSVYSRMEPAGYLDFSKDAHPLSQRFENLGITSVLSSIEIRRFWKTSPSETTRILARFSDRDQSPALLIKRTGKGQVIQLNTAVDLINGATGKNWSDLPRAGWAFIAFADQMLQSLLGRQEQRFNYVIGESIDIAIPPPVPASLLLRLPDLKQTRFTLPYDLADLRVRAAEGSNANAPSPIVPPANGNSTRLTERLPTGNFEIYGDQSQTEILQALTINNRPEESLLQRLNKDELDQLLGAERYELSESIEQLNRQVLQGRLGREIYPVILVLCLLLFCGEHFVANHFYHQEPTTPKPAGAITRT